MVSLDEIKKVFLTALDLPGDFAITDASGFNAVPGWDSVGHMRIVFELEQLIGSPLEIEEIVGLDTVAKIRALVDAKRV
jgi:acyl carrier protein